MTCIAAAVNHETGEFVMGGDSAASSSEAVLTSRMPKVFQNGEFVIGTAGSIRWQQMMTVMDFPRVKKNANLDRYMAIDFPQRLRHAAHDLGCLEEHDNVSIAEGYFLVALRGRIWRIQPNFDSFEVEDGLVAVGSGEPYALGAMKAIASNTTDLRTIVEGALLVAEYYSPHVRGPFTLIGGSATVDVVPDRRQRSVRKRNSGGARKRAGGKASTGGADSQPHQVLVDRSGQDPAPVPGRLVSADRAITIHHLPPLAGAQRQDHNHR